MAVSNKLVLSAYGQNQDLINVPPQPLLAKRAPTSGDKAPLGQIWIDVPLSEAWILVSVIANVATWIQIVTGGAGVFGTIALPSTTAAFATGFISLGGVPAISNFGTNNFFFGVGSGNATLTGTNDTGGGEDSLAALTSGSSDTAYGAFSGEALTTGSNNSFFGAGSGTFVTSGGNNTILGADALNAAGATASQNNTAVGYEAMFATTTATQVVAIGSLAMGVGVTTGAANGSVAIGYQSAQALTSGSANVFVGAGSGIATTTGSDNVGVGFTALAANTTQNNNTAVGADALLVNAGANNTALGFQAGGGVLTGARNILLGYLTGTNYVGAESNNIAIGNLGNVAESNVVRIGTVGTGAGQQDRSILAGSVYVTGDAGVGIATTTGLTNVVATIAGTGALTIVSSTGSTARTNAGFIKIYVGTVVAYIPYYTQID